MGSGQEDREKQTAVAARTGAVAARTGAVAARTGAVAARTDAIKSPDIIIDNKNALIWAFNEAIDKNTDFDGNTLNESITQTKQIIEYLLSIKCFNDNITEEIIQKYLEILNRVKTEIPKKVFEDNDYILCGWYEHAILLFWEKQANGLYNFGMINCGQGADIQGANNILCNGLIIFKDIKENNINNFLETYQKYKKTTNGWHKFKTNKMYFIFYCILFDKLLNIKSKVNFTQLKLSNIKFDFYQIELQLIGSCAFTNLVNFIYYIYIQENKVAAKEYEYYYNEYYINYLNWYNNAKEKIKKQLFNNIINSDNNKFINIYQYILDTTPAIELHTLYEQTTFTNVKINGNYISDLAMMDTESIDIIDRSTINNKIKNEATYNPNIHSYEFRDTIGAIEKITDEKQLIDSLWELYSMHNLEPFISYINTYNNIETSLNYLFWFYKHCNSFDNDNKILIPLLILYKLIKEKKISKILTEDWLNYFYIIHIKSINNTDKYTLINTFIYLILLMLIKQYGTPITKEQKYYNNTDKSKCKKNILFYNYVLFKDIPIINNYYYNIVKTLVKDFNDNIEIFPDITDEEYVTVVFRTHFITININLKDKSKICIEYLSKKYAADDYFSYNSVISINFLLWNILINHINEELPNFVQKQKNIFIQNYTRLQFETYGYYNKEVYDENEQNQLHNFITDGTFGDHIIGYPGGFSAIEQKIQLFKDTIEKKLNAEIIQEKPTFDILKHYIIYFYLCEFSSNTLQKKDDIFKKYNGYITEYFNEYYNLDYFKTLLYTYILKYDLSYNIPVKKIIKLDDNCLISNVEKKYFVLSQYEYIIGENGVFNSLFSFYTIKYNKYTLFFHKNDKTTDESIDIIRILTRLPNFIYIALNFYYLKKDKKIIGINKNNSNIRIEYNEGDILEYNKRDIDILNMDYFEQDKKYKIVSKSNLDGKYLQFYNLMTNNDISIFIYKDEKDTYYLRTLNYDFVFTMRDENIFYTINGNEYTVNFYNDIDIYNNNGILKLSFENNHKLLCIYNYNHILNPPYPNYGSDMTFINPEFFIEKNLFSHETGIPIEFKQHYYKIINKYNNKYIFTNIDEVFALLINCLNYNTPYLILKNIEQIKNILNNNKSEDYDSLLNTLLERFDNIYSISILLLFYKDKKLNEYYYSHANNLYTKYNILLELEYKLSSSNIFNYSILTNNITTSAREYYLYFQFDITKERTFFLNIKPEVTGELIVTTTNNENDTKYDYLFQAVEKYRNNSDYNDLYISVDGLITKIHSFNANEQHSLKIKYVDHTVNAAYNELFKSLLTMYISNLDNAIFDNNIIKATELFEYLILPNKTKLHPIQELIMGSGKTTSITPYICILLLAHFLKGKIREYNYKNEIYIVMPDFLINSSFEILMKYVFPLFNNIEILIHPVKPNYINSFKIYLISDTNYKIMFLENYINTYKKYMIYDEIDMMANPLTCELNKPFNNEQFTVFDDLYILSEILYDDIFNNPNFWDKITDDFQIKENNRIHSYFFIMNDKITEKINIYYDETIKKKITLGQQKTLAPLIQYIKDNVLLFILTKQFNFDYGMPETYSLNLSTKYKFKAIPYSAVDNPLMGSEFSDFILTYVLTFFCYKIVNSKYRKIDKNYIITYFETKDNYEKIFSFLSDRPRTKKQYIDNLAYYKNKYNEKFELDDDEFKTIIKEILKMNSDYYSKCKNISFNDLLLFKNVKNFVCFTGTAYIQVPVDDKHIDFDKTNIINYSSIDSYNKVSDAIIAIIKNPLIVQNLYNNNNNILIDDIFECLILYDVLIDIGGIFISYNINDFITKYKELKDRKTYFVYFDNGRKIYNLETGKFEGDNVVKDRNTFYYFSNKNITGVDAKNIMSDKARGLITITNNTNMRDFSQGIFRMRHILQGQSCDIIFNDIFNDIIMAGGSCDNFKKIIKKGMTDDDIRQRIIKNLENQQNIIEKQKEKVLIKQNIFALNKFTTYEDDNEQILYFDPMTQKYIESIKIFDDYVEEYKSITHTFNIDSFNIIQKNSKDSLTSNPLLKVLVDKYFTSQIDVIESAQNMAQEQEQAQSENTSIAVSITSDEQLMYSGIIYSNFITLNSGLEYTFKNQILVAYIGDIEYLDILLIYDNINNNLVIIDTNKVTNFLIYNKNILQYTFISFYNESIYGSQIDNNLVKYLFQLALTILTILHSNMKEQQMININKLNNYLKLIQHLHNIKYDSTYHFDKAIPTLHYFNVTSAFNSKQVPVERLKKEQVPTGILKDSVYITERPRTVYIKYIKYKTKYLNLKNIKLYPVYHSDNIIKDSDSFYKKYTKYKTKYLQFKNQI